jgi:hypothetical protein
VADPPSFPRFADLFLPTRVPLAGAPAEGGAEETYRSYARPRGGNQPVRRTSPKDPCRSGSHDEHPTRHR